MPKIAQKKKVRCLGCDVEVNFWKSFLLSCGWVELPEGGWHCPECREDEIPEDKDLTEEEWGEWATEARRVPVAKARQQGKNHKVQLFARGWARSSGGDSSGSASSRGAETRKPAASRDAAACGSKGGRPSTMTVATICGDCPAPGAWSVIEGSENALPGAVCMLVAWPSALTNSPADRYRFAGSFARTVAITCSSAGGRSGRSE